MLPFLLLSIRAEPEAADDEYATFLRFSGLDEHELPRVNVHAGDLPELDLDAWSGIVLGGGPWNASDPDASKSPQQRRAEVQLSALLDRVVAQDFPFLGACYGIGTLGTHQGGVVGREHPEGVGPLHVTLTEEGLADPLLAGLPREFAAYGGHKESLEVLPPGAVRLATSTACPVQAFRVGRHVYATQFHPELDLAGVCTRIEVYKDAGYFPPDQAETLKEISRAVAVEHPTRILGNFVQLHAR
ncbi:glutamine amidotransferase [Nocardioides aurantiacus]|uniref:GMP synthase (Glutamine-hydrolysing) n=1 Tax=Nocardioides aurantiacus TaxID=86796 RepID=A0A3N2CQ44_9ACTN|nr:glutamine amidotransferase [Nocardioides aurantiacus]ROR89640.1 GMP synthase (glutamine-hydrolysing) [Nocardioides aurantiacus]